MSIDPDEAIEKLTEYRKDSEARKKEKIDQKTELGPFEIKLRNFLIKFYRFNAVVYVTLGVLMLFGMEYTNIPLFLDFLLGVIALVFPFQIFNTISRLERTKGRKTTVDDVFVTSMLIPMFLLFLFFTTEILAPIIFWIVYAILGITWILQIFYVNYRKPDIEYVARTKSEPKTTTTSKSRLQMILSFFTIDRIIIILVGVLLGFGFLQVLPPA